MLCDRILRELDRALQRPYFAERVTVLERRQADAVLRAAADMLPDPVAPPAVVRDPRDDYLVALARANRVDVIITGDRDRQLGHRPDFVGLVGDDRIAVEVELAPKSKRRLDAILRLHRDWLWDKKTTGIVYICGSEEGRRRIRRANHRIDVMPGYRLRIELLDTITTQTRAEFERARASGDAAAA